MYTTSFRMESYQRSNVGGILRHLMRDVDRQNGEEVRHSNQLIDSALTELNSSYVPDGNGSFRALGSRQEVLDFVESKIAGATNHRIVKDKATGDKVRVPVKIRKDATVVIEGVLALDPNFYEVAQDENELKPVAPHLDSDKLAETVKFLHAARDSLIKQVGTENIAYICEHWDETNPHLQIGFIPICEDGQLSKQKFFGGDKGRLEAQKNYAKMHDVLRTDLQAAGYEATMERVSEGTKGVSVTAYKKRKKRERELDEKQQVLQRRESDLIADQRKLGDAMSKFSHESKSVVAKLNAKGQKLGEREALLDQKAERIKAEKMRAYDDAKAEAKQQLLSIGELTPERLKVDALKTGFSTLSRSLNESNPELGKLLGDVAWALVLHRNVADWLVKNWSKLVATQPTRTAKQIDAIQPPQVQKADDYDIEL